MANQMRSLSLPKEIREKAVLNSSGEYCWRIPDVEGSIQAGRAAQLACLGGTVQFHLEDGICEPYWLSFEPNPRLPDETFETYVNRGAEDALAGMRKLSAETDFDAVLTQLTA